MNRFEWKWYLKDIKQDKPVKVFTTFSCGGGSSMGYKRAGFQVIGNVEIDPKINKMYCKNHHPKYNFNMDLRKFNELEELPDELIGIDILDGSPPCTTFSTAGQREKSWGKKKKFREGQAEQTLDDLFIIDKDGVIISGHTRLLAAIKLGLKEVPCIVGDHLTQSQVKAFRLADNRVSEIATWDDDLLKEEMKNVLDMDLDVYGFDIGSVEEIMQEETGIKTHKCPKCGCEWTQ